MAEVTALGRDSGQNCIFYLCGFYFILLFHKTKCKNITGISRSSRPLTPPIILPSFPKHHVVDSTTLHHHPYPHHKRTPFPSPRQASAATCVPSSQKNIQATLPTITVIVIQALLFANCLNGIHQHILHCPHRHRLDILGTAQ